MEAPSFAYGRLLVVANLTKAGTAPDQRAESQIEYLAGSLCIPVERVKTYRDPLDTRAAILEVVEDTDLVVSKGGEGTALVVAESVMQIPTDERPDFLHAPAGTANDVFHGLNGNIHGRKALSRVVLEGERVAIRPLSVSVHSKEDSSVQTHMGLNIVSFDFSADVAAWLNSTAHRQGGLLRVPLVGRKAQEVQTSMRAMQRLSTFELRESNGGEMQQLLDLSLMIGRVVAKYGRPDIKHTDSDIFEMRTVRPTRLAVIVSMARLSLGHAKGEKREAMSFTTGDEPTLAQIDGETFVIAPDSEVDVTRMQDTLNTYSLLAARQRHG